MHSECSKVCYNQPKINNFRIINQQSKGAKIRNRYNQVPHLTQDTNGKVTNSHLDTTNESQEVSPFPAGDHKAHINNYKFVPYFSPRTIQMCTLVQKYMYIYLHFPRGVWGGGGNSPFPPPSPKPKKCKKMRLFLYYIKTSNITYQARR